MKTTTRKKKKNIGRCLRRVGTLWTKKRSETKRCGQTTVYLYKSWSFLSGIVRLDYRERKKSAAEFKYIRQQRNWPRSGHVDVRNENKGSSRKYQGRGVVSIFSVPRRCVGKWRTKHVLHMLCERTVINMRKVACQWRGTAFSRRRPLRVIAYIAVGE